MTGWSAAWTESSGGRALSGGGKCLDHDCAGYLTLCGDIRLTPPGKILICQTCQRAWCARCRHETVAFANRNGAVQWSYICACCNNGMDVFIGLFPDGEWVHLSPEEIYRLSPPYTEAAISRLAYTKCQTT